MRIASFLIFTSLSLIACKGEPSTTGVTDGESSGGEAGSTSTTDDPTTTSASGGGLCVPGQSVGCACPSGGMGAQVCSADGKSFGDCVCEGGSVSDSQGETTTTTNTTDPGTTTTGPDTTGEPGSTTEPVGSTGQGGSTGADTTGGGACVDPGEEPNEEEDAAIDLGEQGCQADPQTFMGVLNGDADVDWYQYHGQWGFNCGDTDPGPQISLTASDNVRMCVFADCDMSNAMVTCQGGSMMAMSPGGRPGCCNEGDVDLLINCVMSGNEAAQVFVRLDQAPADSCVDYSVDYDYQAD